MKKLLFSVFFTLLLSALVFAGGQQEEGSKEAVKKKIIIDGGGGIVQFNSTKSMEKTDANPYPYNELETLCTEWEAIHPEYEVEILDQSYGGGSDKIIPLLAGRKAPDLLFTLTINAADLGGKGWFLPLDEYYDKPNPYIEGNKKWKDIFVPSWFDAMSFPDGHIYSVPLDHIPIGIIYNKDIFEKAGISSLPESFGELMETQKKISDAGFIPYFPLYVWYDIFLEGSLFADLLPQIDVLRPDGWSDAEEIVRAYKKGIWEVDGVRNREYFRMLKEKTKYYPEGWQSFDAFGNFLQGKVAMMEGVGIHLRMTRDDQQREFNFGYMPYPLVTKEDSPFGGKGIVRGSAGYSSTWFLTNSAKEKGTVDGAIDLMMFLTEPSNNARLVNTLEAMMPASLDAEVSPLFEPLVDKAVEDMNNDFCDWHVFNSWGYLGSEYYEFFLQLVQKYELSQITIDEALAQLAEQTEYTVEEMIQKNNWDTSAW
ncbi:MAG: hypothetical protein B6241_12990 [Spirochaetaceae bacterium 4572_59]|nr:MAG: hypothetical protein B6241_12990 [Spirochaetaceae bacterium 4572_59]